LILRTHTSSVACAVPLSPCGSVLSRLLMSPGHQFTTAKPQGEGSGAPIIASVGGGSLRSRLSRLHEIRFKARPYHPFLSFLFISFESSKGVRGISFKKSPASSFVFYLLPRVFIRSKTAKHPCKVKALQGCFLDLVSQRASLRVRSYRRYLRKQW